MGLEVEYCRRLRENDESLTQMYLSSEISSAVAAQVADSLSLNSTLRDLHLWGNDLKTEGVRGIAQALKSNSSITQLDLYGNRLSSEGATALGELLTINSSLQHLLISYTSLTPEGGTEIARALKSNSTLLQLHLGGNSLGPEGGMEIIEVLKYNSSLKQLNLNGNNIGSEGAKRIGEALQQNRSLQILDVGANRIGLEGGTALARALESNTTLQQLHCRSNQLGPEFGAVMARALEINSTLSLLNLKEVTLGAKGASDLAPALQKNHHLQSLNLDGNDLGSDGAKFLAQVLPFASSLQQLELEFNRIGSQGASALAEALRFSPTLRQLDLASNELGPVGGTEIASSLKENFILQRLDLKRNQLGPEAGTSIAEALEQNASLFQIELAENEVQDAELTSIQEAVGRNRSNIYAQHATEHALHKAKTEALDLEEASRIQALLRPTNHVQNSELKAKLEKALTSVTDRDLANLSCLIYQDQFIETIKDEPFMCVKTFDDDNHLAEGEGKTDPVGATGCAVLRANDVLVVVFRGTKKIENWLTNADMNASMVEECGENLHVHNGFKGMIQQPVEVPRMSSESEATQSRQPTWRSELLRILISETEQSPATRLIYTGHSLGGSLALVCRALHRSERERINVLQVETVTFGAPLVFGKFTAEPALKAVGYKTRCYVHGQDIIPRFFTYRSESIKPDAVVHAILGEVQKTGFYTALSYVPYFGTLEEQGKSLTKGKVNELLKILDKQGYQQCGVVCPLRVELDQLSRLPSELDRGKVDHAPSRYLEVVERTLRQFW